MLLMLDLNDLCVEELAVFTEERVEFDRVKGLLALSGEFVVYVLCRRSMSMVISVKITMLIRGHKYMRALSSPWQSHLIGCDRDWFADKTKRAKV